MNALRNRLRLDDRRDGGLSIVEVVVAMMIFAIISTGAIYTMLSVLRLTRDTRSTQVAANLAAQEIDLSRDVADLFTLLDATRTVVLNGDNFYVARSTQWVSNPSLDLQCGSGGAPLRYKRVNVKVTWDNMRNGTKPVQSDTVIDPKNRINDPALGTILVSVINAAGSGAPGIAVTAAPLTPPSAANGAVPLTETPKSTDAQGCTYILKVKPGNYTVTVSKAGFIDVDQAATSSKVVGVAAGSAASVGFQYDQAGTITASYAADFTARPVSIPSNLDTSYLSTYGTYVRSVTANPSRSQSTPLHPFKGGYEIIAGGYAPTSVGPPALPGCVSPDPAAWQPEKVGGDTYSAARPPAVATAPGGSASTNVRMGIVTLDTAIFGFVGGSYLRAVSAVAPASTGDPGCGTAMTYVFGSILPIGGGLGTIALPFGSWRLYTGDSASQTQLINAGITFETRGTQSGDVITLDPRTIVPPKP